MKPRRRRPKPEDPRVYKRWSVYETLASARNEHTPYFSLCVVPSHCVQSKRPSLLPPRGEPEGGGSHGEWNTTEGQYIPSTTVPAARPRAKHHQQQKVECASSFPPPPMMPRARAHRQPRRCVVRSHRRPRRLSRTTPASRAAPIHRAHNKPAAYARCYDSN